MAKDEGSAIPEKRKRKVKKRTTKQDAIEASALQNDADDEEEVNPGMLLTDFIEDAAAAGQKASRIEAKSGKSKKIKRKRPSAVVPGEDEVDLHSLGQSAGIDDGDEAGASAKLIGAISAATSSRAPAANLPRHAEEALPENEFQAGGTGEDITIEDLLAPLQESTGFGDVKKMLQGMSKKEAMPEPMSEVAQGREERATRYKASVNDVGKWIPQLQRMKKADQVVLGEELDNRRLSTISLVGSFKPSDDFEKELEEVTKAAGAGEEDLIDQKGLPMNTRIRDEKQIQQVARLKALMLRQQQANKRIKKIKSKTYHRIHRKAENREREVLLERLERDNPEMAKSLKQDYEKKFAEKRLQRQRNARKKWAKTMQRFAKGDLNAGKEITKQAQDARDEQQSLRRAIQGRDIEDSDSEDVDLSDSGDETGRKGLAQRTVDKAKELTLDTLSDLKNGGELPTTGIFGLGFMRNAIKQKREAAAAEAQGVLNELEGLGARLEVEGDYKADSDDEKNSDKEDKMKKPVAAPKKPKREFTAEELEKASREVDEMLEQEDVTQSRSMSVSGALTVRGIEAEKSRPLAGASGKSGTASSSTAPAPGATKSKSKSSGKVTEEKKESESNPWLAEDTKEEDNPWLSTGADELNADAATPSASSRAGKTRKKGAAEAAEPTSNKRRRRGVKNPSGDAAPDEDDEDEQPAASATERLNLLDADDAARQQRDLVRATFVEGTQAEDFDREVEEKDIEKDEMSAPKALVGWGSWTGEGVKAPQPKKGKGKGKGKDDKKKHNAPRKANVQSYEGDAAVKAQAKYFVDKVPFPFKNPQQYDREMRMPTGPEWNTLSGHLQKVKPKFFVKTGAIVTPLQYVKHLPEEHKESALNAWASAKQPKRNKARF